MTENLIARTSSAYAYPLLIKQLFEAPLVDNPDQEIVYKGALRSTDRLKDVVKVAGEWVSSLELEDLIAQHPAAAEVAVIGAPDDRWGERPLALVVLTPGDVEGGAEKSILHFVKEYVDKGFVSKHALLLKVKAVEAIDKTSVGKTNKVALRQKYL